MGQFLDNWIITDGSRKKGGQGTIVIVTNKSDETVKGALKQMHVDQQRNVERRERMKREIEGLKRVVGNGVPILYEDNSSDIRDIKVPLYFISQWINGKTLHEIYFKNPTSIEEAIRITRELCLIVDRCHQNNVRHRDIKPKNILIEENGTIYLVDFGLAWIKPLAEEIVGFNSRDNEELSNCFLRLDELITGSKKHEKTSDITFLVGVFFFLLTGEYPKSLTDGRGEPPHVTLMHCFKKEDLEDKRWYLIHRIFKVGFQLSLDHRIGSAIDLIKLLDDVKSIDEEINDLEGDPHIQKLQMMLSANSFEAKTKIFEKFRSINEEVEQALRIRANGYKLNSGSSTAIGPTYRTLYMNFTNEVYSDVNIEFWHKISFVDIVGQKMSGSFQIGRLSRPTIYFEGYSGDHDTLAMAVHKRLDEIFIKIAATYTQSVQSKLDNQNIAKDIFANNELSK